MVEALIVIYLLYENYFISRIYVLDEENIPTDPYYQLIYGTAEVKESPAIEAVSTVYNPPITERVKVETTELDKDETSFLSNLVDEFSENTTPDEDEDNYLTFDEEELDNLFYLNVPSSQIGKNEYGPQEWIVTVVGMEGNYIHVFDGKKAWVNVGDNIKDIYMNDLLLLKVDRQESGIKLLNVTTLNHVTDDYVIPDEEIIRV